MSSDPAVSVRGLGKAYRIDHGPDFDTFSEVALHRLRHPFQRRQHETFWALRDVSFDVQPGEVVGFIGRNGAGKSTLLKLLTRITEPTEGEATMRGRVGSLLEVGTGFHRELTGRENIYLNGGILGMSRREITRHFDEIVDFAGTEKFLDTPVKRYSSGMFVRLAFAVAAHLRTDILIVDEVLAVGDVAFQTKCLDKMREVTGEGRTVLFVSHNMGTIQSLCDRALFLQDGRVQLDGDVHPAVQAYLAEMETAGSLATDVQKRSGTGDVEITAVRLVDEQGQPTDAMIGGADVQLEVEYLNHADLRHPKLIGNLYDSAGRAVSSFSSELTAPDLGRLARRGRFVCRFPRLPLVPGRYRFALALHADGMVADTLKSAATINVVASTFYSTGLTPQSEAASLMLDHRWAHEVLEAADEVRSSIRAT